MFLRESDEPGKSKPTAVVDPYNCNGGFNLPLNKGKAADAANHRIRKLAYFYRHTPPEMDLILGGSRGG